MNDNQSEIYISGRGAQLNTPDPFSNLNHFSSFDDRPIQIDSTTFLKVHPKTIVNRVKSPDLHFDFSINPYQGCEHGCVYCYARNTHPYWGYSAGLDFESKVLFKPNAADILEKQLRSRKWKAAEIMLSGNTDCYQPIEKKLKITRSLLELFWKFRNPVGIITKNALIERDLDLLKKLSEHALVKVIISITTEDEKIRRIMEPRTATAEKRFEVIKKLSKAGIPVFALMAPIIPGLTDAEILPIAKKAADAGARDFGYGIVRLNGDVATIFEDWLDKTMPARKQKILKNIKTCHQGNLSNSNFNSRMKGSGTIAQIIKDQVNLARRIYFKGRVMPAYNLNLHDQYKLGQLKLF